VRDLDVMLDKAEKDADEHEQLSREGLEPLLRSWEKQRKSARKEMEAYLCGKAYAEFKRDFERFLGLPHLSSRGGISSDSPGGVRVRYVAPGLLWEHYGRVRAYEPRLVGAPVDTLHALRIDGKRFRYALEFLQEPLGKPANKLISILTKAQDHLGELHDADVATHLLRQFLEGWWRKAAKEGGASSGAQGVTHYLFLREQELQEKIQTFPTLWERLAGEEFRLRLAEVTAAL
jgi:CHAD domain-containing protein